MANTDEIIRNITEILLQWKNEGILEEKLKEYGFVFADEQAAEDSSVQEPLEKKT